MDMDNENQVFVELQEFILIDEDNKECLEQRQPLSSIQSSDPRVEPQPHTSGVKLASKNSMPAPEYKRNINDSKILIDFYSKYKNKIGTFEIKNQKMLWEKIALELQKIGILVTPNNCLNRWRVLERNYKKFVDSQNKTGRGRKYFEYETEMADIFGKKKNIHPEILLHSESVASLIESTSAEEPSIETPETAPKVTPVKVTPGSSFTPRRVRPPLKTLTTIEKFRQDKKDYFDAKLQIEKEKLQELKRRNDLIAERNEILRNFKCNCPFNSIL